MHHPHGPTSEATLHGETVRTETGVQFRPAVWPHDRPLYGCWFIQGLVGKGEIKAIWRERTAPGDNDTVFAKNFSSRVAATADHSERGYVSRYAGELSSDIVRLWFGLGVIDSKLKEAILGDRGL